MTIYNGTTVSIQISADGSKWTDLTDYLPKPTRKVDWWPYGKQFWFLPHYEIEAEITDARTDGEFFSLDMTGSDVRDLTDYRLHAQFLRWMVIKWYALSYHMKHWLDP